MVNLAAKPNPQATLGCDINEEIVFPKVDSININFHIVLFYLDLWE